MKHDIPLAPVLKWIQDAADERMLHALGWLTHSLKRDKRITAKYYTKCFQALETKLGFPPLEENLKTAADFDANA